MGLLGEIVDKMPTIGQMWLVLALMGVVLSLPGMIHRYIAIGMFIIGTIISIYCMYSAYHQAFVAADLSVDIRIELGSVWVFHSLISSVCPALITGLIIYWHYRKRQPKTEE